MYKIKIEIGVEEALNLLKKVDDKEEFLTLFGGRSSFIKDCLNLFLENGTIAFDFRETFNEILFEESDADDTYLDVWNEFWYDGLNKLPLKFLLESLLEYKPGKRSEYCSDVALNYLLERYYYVSNVEKLTEEQVEELFELFEDLSDKIPSGLSEYKLKKDFETALLEFKDFEYISNNYNNVSYDTKECTELLCKVAANDNIDLDHLELFCDIIKYHAPANQFDRKYYDLFVLTIFEANDNWSDEEMNIITAYFYNINFEECSYRYQQAIDDSYQKESDYISEKLKLNPNYRHD